MMNFFQRIFRMFMTWWGAIFGGDSGGPTTTGPSSTPTLAPNTLRTPISIPIPLPTPVLAPIPIPTPPPIVAPAPVPVAVSTPIPVPVPVPIPVPSPTIAPTKSPTTLSPILIPSKPDPIILINCGGTEYKETSMTTNRTWLSDRFFTGGWTFTVSTIPIIQNTNNHPDIFHSERYGSFTYNIPVPVGNYEVILHFAELIYPTPGYRIFNMNIEGKIFRDIDIVALSPMQQSLTAITINVVTLVEDGFITIALQNGKSENAKLNGIEVILVAPHLAHAVASSTTGLAYSAVDIQNIGSASIQLDGSASHTHGIGLVVTQYIWRDVYGTTTSNSTGGNQILATNVSPTLSLRVGNHTISLTIIDSDGNESTDTTTVSIYPFGYPAIVELIPNRGSITGGEDVYIIGSGFTYPPEQTIVHFGIVDLTGPDDIQILNSTAILIKSPPTVVGAPVQVRVETPLQISTPMSYTYIASSEIKFTSTLLYNLGFVTTGTFGPDGKLYLGTYYGTLAKLTLNDDYTNVISSVIVRITTEPQRAILGIAFDPADVFETNPPVYCTSSQFFHKGTNSSSGLSINGIVHKISGPNLNIIENIITGLPVSDHDHGINNIEFGDSRELYFTIGGNTNGGIPGKISGSQLQKENYYSAATIVAYIHRNGFNGTITYDALDDGLPITGSGIEIFCSGNRNTFGITLHSNGYLYGTDNGPNTGYGAMMAGCAEGMMKPDVKTQDRVDVLLPGRYYGHPNRIRAIRDNDSRQCVYHNPELDPAMVNGTVIYQRQLAMMPSAIAGIMEYTADYFDRQLRHNLIVVKYTSAMFRLILRSDGLGVIPQSTTAIPLGIGAQGLSITQAPDGTIIDMRYSAGKVWYHKAVENITSSLKVYSVFPRRGPHTGGYTLNVFGANLNTTTIVTIVQPRNGDVSCPVISVLSPTKLTCLMPAGDRGTTVHVRLSYNTTTTTNGETYQFARGFRYVTGLSP